MRIASIIGALAAITFTFTPNTFGSVTVDDCLTQRPSTARAIIVTEIVQAPKPKDLHGKTIELPLPKELPDGMPEELQEKVNAAKHVSLVETWTFDEKSGVFTRLRTLRFIDKDDHTCTEKLESAQIAFAPGALQCHTNGCPVTHVELSASRLDGKSRDFTYTVKDDKGAEIKVREHWGKSGSERSWVVHFYVVSGSDRSRFGELKIPFAD